MDKRLFAGQLILEKFTAPDFDNYYRLVSNSKVMEMITERAMLYDEAIRKFEKIIQDNNLHPAFGTFKISDILTNDFIGSAKLTLYSPAGREAELGYMLLPEYWGMGIASMVASRLIDVARSDGTIDRVFAIIDPENIPSRKILLKNEFKSEKFMEINGLKGEILELRLH